MSVRLFHRDGRVVLRMGTPSRRVRTWRALHVRSIAWADVFGPALALLGFTTEAVEGGLCFDDGSVRWTKRPFWTTIRLELPECSPKKEALLAAALLKAARYRSVATEVQSIRTRSA